MRWYTDLRSVFQALGDRQSEYEWLLTDLDWCALGSSRVPPAELLGSEPVWLTGAQLTRLAHSELQFIWGVFSGFPVGTTLDLAQLTVYPYADGNPGFWTRKPEIQHPKAAVELVCWDSCATLLLSTDNDLTQRFRSFFPEARDLNEYNNEVLASTA